MFFLEEVKATWDRFTRKDINENFKKIERNFNGVVEVVSNQAYEQVVDAAKLIWLTPVATFADLATTYPNAREGDTAMAREVVGGVNKAYRYNGMEWKEIQQISADAVNEVDHRLSSQLAQKAGKDEVNALASDKADITYVNQQVQASNTQWKRSFATLADLQSTYPTGDTFNHVVLADGFIYTWFDGAWTSTQIEANARKLADGIVSPQKTTFVKTGKNLFNKNDYNVGYVANANTGALVTSSSNNSSSKYISVLPNQSYTKSPSAATESAQVFYDANFNYISSSTGSPFIAPANSAFVIVNIANANIEAFQLENGTTATTYEDYYLIINGLKPEEIQDESISAQKTNFAKQSKNLFNRNTITTGSVINASGNVVSSSGRNSVSDFIEVLPNSNYIKNYSTLPTVAFYDANRNFIRSVNSQSFLTPANAKYVRINIQDILLNSGQLEMGTQSTDYSPYGYIIDLVSDNLPYNTLGVAYHLTQNASICVRLDGVSNVNNHYPFNSVRLCNVLKTDFGGTQITYNDDAPFKRDGSNGHVMVEIPKVYYKRYRKNNYEYILISGVEYDGFNLHPAFVEGGKPLEKIYVAAYDSVLFNDVLFSRSGLKPASDYTISEARTLSKANGKGFGLFDMRTLNLVQMLFLIYFADRNSQLALGRGMVSYSWQSSAECICRLTATQTNTIRVRYDYESYTLRGFAVGQNVTVSSGTTGLSIPRKITAMSYVDATFLDITFDGTPVDLVDGTSKIYSLPCDTGATDSIAHHVGISSVYGGKDGHEAIKFLHIENLWGNIWNYIDGFAINNLVAYVSDSMDDYTSDLTEIQSKYKPLGWRVPLQDTNRQDAAELTTCYVKNMMYDATNAAYLVPLELGNGSSDAQGFADPFYSHGDGLYFSNFGGGIDHVIRAGLFTHRVWVSETSKNILLNGSRLQFKPL